MNSEKECVPNANINKCAVVLLDVAGTTTSLAFVKETLFTFATDNAHSFLKDNWEDEEIKKAVKLLKEDDAELDIDGAIEVFKKLTGENSDNKGLKTLQGLIYKKGYADNKLKAHVFSDVPKTFENWAKERKVAIYSTGSIESQRLLFTHSTEGNLSQYISHYFDQSVGLKTDSESYKKIAAELKVKAEEIVFINDNIDELKAAKEAGVLPVLVKREGNEEVSEDASKNLTVVSSFADLPLDNSNKRKNEEEIDGTEAPPTKIAKTVEEEKGTATADSSAKEITDKPEAVAVVEKQDASSKVEEKPEATESKPELVEKDQKTNEQPVEKAETEDEPMEVDIPEIEKKTDSTTENNATNAAPKEDLKKEVNVAEAMETEQLKETPVAEVKTVVEPVGNSKTDTEKLAEQVNKEKPVEVVKGTPKKSDDETMETDHKTEESQSKKDTEVASKAESVDVKKNGVEIVEVKVLEKDTEKIEVAEEAKEIVKDKDQNGELTKDNVEKAEEATENKKDEVDVATEVTESKTIKETEKKEAEKKEAEPVEDKKVVEKAIKEKEPPTETANKTKDQKPTETEKSSEEPIKVSETVKECPEEKKEDQKATEKCSGETKEPCPKITDEPAAVTKEEPSEQIKETKEKASEEKIEASKNEKTNNETIVSEAVAKDLKELEETVKAQANTSENKIGNGSCVSNATEDVAKNGEITNGQENGDKKEDETDPEATDIKIKKLETNTGSPAVSVEV